MRIIGYRDSFALEWEIIRKDHNDTPMGVQFIWLNGKRIGIPGMEDYFTGFSNLYELLISNSKQLKTSQDYIVKATNSNKSIWDIPKTIRPLNSSVCFDDFPTIVSLDNENYVFYWELAKKTTAYPTFIFKELVIDRVSKDEVDFAARLFFAANKTFSI
jgi:hypothetical protein